MGEVAESSPAQYASVLRDRWLLILVATIIGGLVGGAYLYLAPTAYTASAAVQLNVISSDPFQSSQSPSDLIDGRTEASIATSYSVASLAAEKLDSTRTPNEIRQATEASPVADATVLVISYTDNTASAAREGADVIAASYLEFRESQAQARLASMVDMIDDQLSGLRRELVDANAMAAAARPNSSEANQAASDRELVTIEINSLINRKNVLESINTVGGLVLTPARDNPVEKLPNARTVAASGVLGGFLLGLVLAFVSKGLDRRVRSGSEITRLTGGPVLAELGDVRSRVPAEGEDLAALRLAREHILGSMSPAVRNVLIVDQTTSAAEAVDFAGNLALVFAQGDEPVDLIIPAVSDGSVERLAAALRLEASDDASPGRNSALVPRLTVFLTAPGAEITEPDPIITSLVRRRLKHDAATGLRFLALPEDATPAARYAAYRHSEGAVLVLAKGETHAERAAAIAAELRAAHVSLLGVILVRRGRATERRAGSEPVRLPAREPAR